MKRNQYQTDKSIHESGMLLYRIYELQSEGRPKVLTASWQTGSISSSTLTALILSGVSFTLNFHLHQM